MSRPKHIRASGFTLVEILVVVVIIGIAGAIIVPQLGTRDDLRVSAAARVMMADLIYAQNLAITKQKNHYVRFDTVSQTYSVLEENGTTVVTHPISKSPFTLLFGPSGSSGVEGTVLTSSEFRNAMGDTFSMIGFDELGTPVVKNGANVETMTSGRVVVGAGTFSLQIDVESYTGQISVN